MNNRRAIILPLVAIAVAAGLWRRGSQQPGPPPKTPLDRAFHTCGPCGLERDDVTWLIDAVEAAELTREEQLNLFSDQFEDASNAGLCEPCATAILNAAPTTKERNGRPNG